MPVVQGMVACDMKHKLGMVACDMRHKLGMVACDMRHKLGIVACDLMHMLMFIVWLIHYTRETPSLVPKPNHFAAVDGLHHCCVQKRVK